MIHRWDTLTFLHWSYDPKVIQQFLPDGLHVETHDDRAWVGLVPFAMVVRPPRLPTLPWISRFWETNVRTYVTAPDGTRGVWFLSLDAARLAAVVAGRLTYAMPYHWSKMSVERDGDEILYQCRRRWPGPTPATSSVRVRIGDRFTTSELTPFDHFLTARWRLYADRGRLSSALAEHDPWELRHAEVLDCDDGLVAAAGLPAPSGPPVAHWSEGTEVRIGFPARLNALT